MAGIVDSHCHLDHLTIDVDAALEAARSAGVARVVDIGMGTASSAAVAARARDHAGIVFGAVGIHPNDVSEFVADEDAVMTRLAELAAEPGIVGVGETGLDFYRDRSDPRDQERSFEAHIELARRSGKALVIHCRDAHERLLQILDGNEVPSRVVMHCFSGDGSFARRCADRGWFCSFAGNLTYPRNEDLRAVAAILPADLLLVETDAPYLAPVPNRGKDNVPAWVRLTADALAAARGTRPADLDPVLSANTARAFALPA